MKKGIIMLMLVVLFFTMVSAATAEGLLPELDDLYGVAMPSLFDTLNREPDEQDTLDNESVQEIWHNVSDTEYTEFGDFLSQSGCEMASYKTDGSIFDAEITKEGKSFFFSYNTANKDAVLIYPKGTYDGLLDETERIYQRGVTAYERGDVIGARKAFWQAGRFYKDSDSYINEITAFAKKRFILEGAYYGIKPDGQVFVANKDYGNGNNKVQDWNSITSISASRFHTVGIKNDGSVVAVGTNKAGSCNVKKWNDIVDVCATGWNADDKEDLTFTIGLRSDGTVVATGYNEYGQCNVTQWEDIISIKAVSLSQNAFTIGLKAEGTVITTDEDWNLDVSDWQDVISLYTGHNSWGGLYIVGLLKNGTVVASGIDGVSKWNSIISIAAGYNHLVGLRKDGSVVATGFDRDHKCDVGDWNNIIEIATGEDHTVGLKADGTVIATGDNSKGQCNVGNWTEIVSVFAKGWNTYGIKSDGSVVATGWEGAGSFRYLNVAGWDLWDEWNLDINTSQDIANNANAVIDEVNSDYETLKRGSRGEPVVNLQNALVMAGALSGKVDGDFGRMTEEAVKQMQTEYGMEATGIADEEFQKKLYGE